MQIRFFSLFSQILLILFPHEGTYNSKKVAIPCLKIEDSPVIVLVYVVHSGAGGHTITESESLIFFILLVEVEPEFKTELPK